MTTKGVKNPYIHFIGNSATGVTGSCYHLRHKKYSLLLDCGLTQGNDIMTDYKLNREMVKKIKTRDVDYILGHECHIDHTGLIPYLFSKGSKAHIYFPKGSTEILRLLWQDSMKIFTADCQKLQRKRGMKATPYYTQKDVESALNRIIEIDYNVPYQINEDITITYIPSGHLIYSAQTMIQIKEGSVIKRLLYTGDLGGTMERPYVEPRQTPSFADVVIGESTYNTPNRMNKAYDRVKDVEKIHSAVDEYNKILFPAFSLGRTQELLTLLYKEEIYKKCPIYLDSPLAQKICSVWPESKEWNNIMSCCKKIESYEASEALQRSNEHCVIVAAGGMLNGGRAVSHLKTILPNPKNHIIFIGYASPETLAGKIKANQKEIVIDGESFHNQANFTELMSFSSHASYEELLDFYTEIRYNKIALVHGEYSGKVGFCQTLQDKLREQGRPAKVVCVNEGTKISF